MPYERTHDQPREHRPALSEYIALGDWRLFFLQPRRGRRTSTATQVQGAARNYFRRDNRTVGLFLPEDNPQRAEIPQAPSAAELMKDYKPESRGVDAGDLRPQPGEHREARPAPGSRRHEGRAAVEEEPRRNGELRRCALPAGDETVAVRPGRGRLADRRDAVARHRRAIRANSCATSSTQAQGTVAAWPASAQSSRPRARTSWQPSGSPRTCCSEPAFPASGIRAAQEPDDHLHRVVAFGSATRAPRKRSSATSTSIPRATRAMRRPLQEQLEGIEAVTLDDVKRFHKDFYAANRAQFAIVGDFDEAEIAQGHRGELRQLAQRHALEAHHPRVPRHPRAGNIAIETPDKENAMLLARINLDVNQRRPRLRGAVSRRLHPWRRSGLRFAPRRRASA